VCTQLSPPRTYNIAAVAYNDDDDDNNAHISKEPHSFRGTACSITDSHAGS